MRVCNRMVKEGAEDVVSLALSAGYLQRLTYSYIFPIVSPSSPVALTLAH